MNSNSLNKWTFTVCEGQVSSVFSNGVEYNETLHGGFTRFIPRNGRNCLVSLWYRGRKDENDGLTIVFGTSCRGYKERFFCLQPANSSPKKAFKRSKRREMPLGSGDYLENQPTSLFAIFSLFFACFVTVGCWFLVASVRTLKKKNRSLKEKNAVLETENSLFKTMIVGQEKMMCELEKV